MAGLITLALFGVSSCSRAVPETSGKLKQRGYLWQREWNPAVVDGLREARARTDGVVLLGAEIVWENGEPKVIAASIDWKAVRTLKVRCSVALRVAPVRPMFSSDTPAFGIVVATAKSLLQQARDQGVTVEEFQLDFDCAQKELATYRTWLSALKKQLRGFEEIREPRIASGEGTAGEFPRPAPGASSPKGGRFVITVLPAWMNEPEFVRLIAEADGYVLQVHSVPVASANARTMLCDPVRARAWIRRAAEFTKPFAVALPTYRCAAGYAPTGKLLSVAMDSVQPAWPPDTRILEFEADAAAIAGLVHDLESRRPSSLEELLWYRLPVASDQRNWSWPTLAAVMAGRPPVRQLEAAQEGDNPVDLALINKGESDERPAARVIATWEGPAPEAADALTGWKIESEAGRAIFSSLPGFHIRLAPGAKRKIGWLRFSGPTSLRLELVLPNAPSP